MMITSLLCNLNLKFMKKLFIPLVILTMVPLSSLSQEVQSKVREIGVSFSSLNNFGIRYRSGNENTLFRLTFLSINGASNSYTQNYVSNYINSFGFGLNLGVESRKFITDKMDSYWGVDLLSSYDTQTNKYDPSFNKSENQNLSIGMGLIIGLNYRINSNLSLSAEVIPSVRYLYNRSTNTTAEEEATQTNKSFQYGFSNNGANLTLSYRFGKKN